MTKQRGNDIMTKTKAEIAEYLNESNEIEKALKAKAVKR